MKRVYRLLGLFGSPVLAMAFTVWTHASHVTKDPAGFAQSVTAWLAWLVVGGGLLMEGLRKTRHDDPPRPSAFVLRPGAFRAPRRLRANRRGPGLYVGLGGVLAHAVSATHAPYLASFNDAALLLVALTVGVAFAVYDFRAVRADDWVVEMTSQAVRLNRRIDHRVVPWDAIAGAVAYEPWHQLWDGVELSLARPELVENRRWWHSRSAITIPYAAVDIDPLLLAGAIDHYARHREDRWRIGRAEEQDRLHAELFGARPVPAPVIPPAAGTTTGSASR